MTTTLTVVGSGTLLPDAERGSASFHVEASGSTLLMDVGPGTLHGLARLGLDWRVIDAIAISHYHTDHVSDLPALLAAYRFDGGGRPLTLVGPVGLEDFIQRMAALYGHWILEPSRPLAIEEIGEGGDPWHLDEHLRLAAASTPHTDESLAFRVTTEAGVIGYTADTGPSERLRSLMQGCAVLVAECAIADPPEIDTHLSPRSVAELASATMPELLVVSHVYPPRSPEQAAAEIAAHYAGRIEAARDGLTIVVADRRVTVDPPTEAL